MNKSSHFIGQLKLNQLLKLVDRGSVNKIIKLHKMDKYYKTFCACDHLVSMLYASLTNSKTLRQLSKEPIAIAGNFNQRVLK